MSERQLKIAITAMGIWKTVLEPVFAILVIFAVAYWLFRDRPIRVCVANTATCASICGTIHGTLVGTRASDACAAAEPVECSCAVP